MLTPAQTKKNQRQLTVGYEAYSKKLNLYANSRMHNREVSEDSVQDAFKKTWSYLVRGGKIEMMEAFLYHILRDLIVDTYRKHKSTSLDALLEKGFEPGVDGTDRMINILDGKTAVLLINKLPMNYRKIMYMKYIQDLTLEEMSLITGETKNNIAVRAHRGLEKMRLFYHDTKI